MPIRLHIKNMVCDRCIQAVEEVLNQLKIPYHSVLLGEVSLERQPNSAEQLQLESGLSEKGFELLKDHNSRLINQIKSSVIEYVHYDHSNSRVNFSTYLSEELNQEYSSLSKLFSSVEGITIEKFLVKQRIEKVKEFIIYNELTLSEIAHQLNFSSVAHLSSQFKKETGMSPSSFRKLKKRERRSLDSL